MKRFALVIFACLMAFVAHAQTEHLKFSGIPINGTLSQFQSKLVGKGYTEDKLLNNYSSGGSKFYKGNFIGNRVTLIVYYDQDTKNVYRVKAVIRGLTEDMAENKLSDIKDKLQSKYEDCYYSDDEKDGRPSFSILPKRKLIADEFETKWHNSYGEIDLFISKNEDLSDYPYHFNLHIDYNDQINSDKHENKVMDDL